MHESAELTPVGPLAKIGIPRWVPVRPKSIWTTKHTVALRQLFLWSRDHKTEFRTPRRDNLSAYRKIENLKGSLYFSQRWHGFLGHTFRDYALSVISVIDQYQSHDDVLPSRGRPCVMQTRPTLSSRTSWWMRQKTIKRSSAIYSTRDTSVKNRPKYA